MNYIKCGAAPKPLGVYETPSKEMMFYLYLPVKFPHDRVRVPTRLAPFLPMVAVAQNDFGINTTHFIYLTVKTMPVTKTFAGNREGWHIDGFGSGGDVNYIWANMNPTEFAVQDFKSIPDDDVQSMVKITQQIDSLKIKTWPNKTLLRLDESVVHRVSPYHKEGLRTFMKITFSEHQFRNEGNSKNHLIQYDWDAKERGLERNLDHG